MSTTTTATATGAARASARGLVDLSFAPGKDQTLSDLPFDAEMLRAQPAEEVRELNITHAQVRRLTSAPGALLTSVVQHVTVLRAAHNGISGLHGIDAFHALEVLDLSHNHLRVVDAHAASLLRTLRHLRAIDLSYNNMNLLDLHSSTGAPSSRFTPTAGSSATPSSSTNGAAAAAASAAAAAAAAAARAEPSSADRPGGLLSLTAVNVSHNAFLELPDLRSAPHLHTLNLSHNRIDSLVDLDARLPLLSLQSLALHANRLPAATALLPLCGLAATLKHVQVFRNPFTLARRGHTTTTTTATRGGGAQGVGNGHASQALDTAMWWRPFLLWLCPMLATVDQSELTASERRVAGQTLFREHGVLSKSHMEIMNAPRKDDLEAYLRRTCETATPPRDALGVINSIEAAEESRCEYASAAWDGAEEDGVHVVAPLSRTHAARSGILSTSTSTYADPAEPETTSAPARDTATAAPLARGNNVNGGGGSSGGGSARVVVVAPVSPLSMSPSNSTVLVTHHNRQYTQSASTAAVVRALQKKLRTLEGVVAVLWRTDLARRTAAAVVIQRVVRGALARMHLSEEEAECCHFIRYQLQQATATATAAALSQASRGLAAAPAPASLTGGPAARGVSQRHPSLEPVTDTGANMEEVLVSMRSLQAVMSSMWGDLEEYRAMADREQRRAAVLIQRHYRGYRARREHGRVPRRRHAADSTAVLRQEVDELRGEVRELRELLQQATRRQRLASYGDPEQAMDAIIRRHERHTAAEPLDGRSRSPSATPSLASRAAGVSASPEMTAGNGGALDQDLLARRMSAGDRDDAQGRRGSDGTPAAFGGSVSVSGSPEPAASPDSMSPDRLYASGHHPSRITKSRPTTEAKASSRSTTKGYAATE